MIGQTPRDQTRGAAVPGTGAAQLARDVTFRSPILLKPVSGKDLVVRILVTAEEVLGAPRYTAEFRDGRRSVFLWEGAVEGHPLSGVEVVEHDADGLVRDLAVLMRPYPVVTLFRQAMHRRLAEAVADVVTPDYWELLSSPAACPAG